MGNPENEAKGSKGMMMIVIIMLGVIIAALVAGFIFLFTQINADQPEQVLVIVEPPPLSEMDIRAVQLSSPITTNLLQAPGGARHVVRLEVGLGINNINPDETDEFVEMLMEREIVIFDRITSILRRTTADEINRVGGNELLAEDILISLQDAFDTTMIVRVFLGQVMIN